MHKMQHITDKELNILKYFYEYKSGHVRQIKKAVNLSEHTLLKYLKRLSSMRILLSRRQGNMKIFEVNYKNLLVKVFFSYFDILRINGLEYKRRRAVEEFLLRIKEIKIPYFVLLFGSTAKGGYRKKSDIDLIIVYDTYERETGNKMNGLVKDVFAETGLRINFILMLLEEFIREKDNKGNYALQDALQMGYPVFGNILFYEVML